jgi:hypothetical protein
LVDKSLLEGFKESRRYLEEDYVCIYLHSLKLKLKLRK